MEKDLCNTKITNATKQFAAPALSEEKLMYELGFFIRHSFVHSCVEQFHTHLAKRMSSLHLLPNPERHVSRPASPSAGAALVLCGSDALQDLLHGNIPQ